MEGADWVKVSDSPWNNDPSYSGCIFANPPELPIVCDVVVRVSWYGMDGWYTTTGVNSLFALNDQDVVIEPYPDA